MPVIATDSTATPAEESTEATSPTTGPKEQKRKSSFFSPFKKEKKADDVKSDTEEGEPSSPKPSTSPVPKPGLLTLIRRASKAGKGKETEPKEVVAPATVAEEVTPAATATATETETPNGAPAATESDAIGEVSETVAVGQGHAVQAAA